MELPKLNSKTQQTEPLQLEQVPLVEESPIVNGQITFSVTEESTLLPLYNKSSN
jgi:hypothetical protein